MKPERTADEKLLAALTKVGRPLERGELARELGWSKQRVGAVLLRLVPEGKVHARLVEMRPGDTGRPPSLYGLPGMMEPQPATLPFMPRAPWFTQDTIVVTPTDREARVIRMVGREFVEIEYLHVRLGHEPRATMKATLLRAIQPGRQRPEPVRISMPATIEPDPTLTS